MAVEAPPLLEAWREPGLAASHECCCMVVWSAASGWVSVSSFRLDLSSALAERRTAAAEPGTASGECVCVEGEFDEAADGNRGGIAGAAASSFLLGVGEGTDRGAVVRLAPGRRRLVLPPRLPVRLIERRAADEAGEAGCASEVAVAKEARMARGDEGTVSSVAEEGLAGGRALIALLVALRPGLLDRSRLVALRSPEAAARSRFVSARKAAMASNSAPKSASFRGCSSSSSSSMVGSFSQTSASAPPAAAGVMPRCGESSVCALPLGDGSW